MIRSLLLSASLGAVLFSTGCQTVYNSALENVFGYEKRELLAKAVKSVSAEQQEAQAEFKDALTRLKELYAFDGGQLEATYKKLNSAYEDCTAQAGDVKKRIDNMEDIAQSMFAEWEKEIGQFENKQFAANSRQQLGETRTRYAQLSKSVRESEGAMKPVLQQLKDHVLYLKHNLNAAAIGSLKGEGANIQAQIDSLVKRMNDSIAEADAFIKTLPK